MFVNKKYRYILFLGLEFKHDPISCIAFIIVLNKSCLCLSVVKRFPQIYRDLYGDAILEPIQMGRYKTWTPQSGHPAGAFSGPILNPFLGPF